MGYELRLSPQTQENITRYIRENVDAGAKTEVLDAIYAAMHSLTQGPPEARRQTRPGPLVYRFQVRASDGIGRFLEFAYSYTPDEVAIRISHFGPVSF
jgi:hypothetical protein